MNRTTLSGDQMERVRAAISVTIGFLWLLAVTSVADPVSIWLDSRYRDGFQLGVSAELLLIAVTTLPLAFIHSPGGSVARVWVVHSGAFAMLATFSVLLSPTGPFSLLPWGDSDVASQPAFSGPFAVWVTTSLIALGVETLGRRIRGRRADPRLFEVISWGVLMALIAVNWWFTMRFIMGGFPLLTRLNDWSDTAIRGSTMAGYVALGSFCAGLFRRKNASPSTE